MKISTFILIALSFVVLLFLKKKEAQHKAKHRNSRRKQRNKSTWPNAWNGTKRRKEKQPALSVTEKGELAEKELELALKRRLKKQDWYIFNNVTLKRNDDDGTTQIDLVAVSVFGIFVIEVKNLTGSIYANNGANWVQYFYNGERFDFQNPHRQNHAHMQAIAQALKPLKTIDPSQIQSVVALLGEAKYKGLPENTYTDIDSLIAGLEAQNEKRFAHGAMAIAIGLIEHSRFYDLPETDQAHIEYLEKKHTKNTDQTGQTDCKGEAHSGTEQPQPIEPTVSEAIQG